MLLAESKDDRDYEPKGLSDGGHIILRCSNCEKNLVDIWITQPDAIDPKTGEIFKTSFRAKCCYCNDFSFPKEILGKFHIGGYGRPDPEDPENSFMETIAETSDLDYSKEPITIPTIKR